MSQFVQSLESRTLFSTTAAASQALAADAKGVSAATAAVNAAVKNASAAFNADARTIATDLNSTADKTARKTNAALVKTLKTDGARALAALKTDAARLATASNATAKRAAADAAALLKKPTSAALQAKVAADAASLGTVSVAPLAKLLADAQALGLNTDLANITSANPSNAKLAADAQTTLSHLSAVASTLTSNGTVLTTALATLSTAVNSTPTQSTVPNLVGTYSGSTITASGPNQGQVHFLTLNITTQQPDGTLAGTASFDQGAGPIALNFSGKAVKDNTPYSDAIITGTLTDPGTPGRGMTLSFNAFGHTLQGSYTGTGGIENATFTITV